MTIQTEQIFIDEEAVFGKSVFIDHVTVVDMPERTGTIVLHNGKAMTLRATTPFHTIDHKILFGSGVDEPIGIIDSPATILYYDSSYVETFATATLACMANHALSLTTAKWIVNAAYTTDLQVIVKQYKLLDLPVIPVNNNVLMGRQFKVGLFSLQYYILGKYKSDTGSGVKIDGMPVLSSAIITEDKMQQFSPFIVAL